MKDILRCRRSRFLTTGGGEVHRNATVLQRRVKAASARPPALPPLSPPQARPRSALRCHTGSLRSLLSAEVLILVAQAGLTLCDPTDCSCQAPLSLGVSMQEYWSGLPCPPPGHLPDPGIKPVSPAVAGGSFPSAPQ